MAETRGHRGDAAAGVRGTGPLVTTLTEVGRALIERRLRDVSGRLKTVSRDLAVAEEQLAQLVDEADDARMRALVSETPVAEHEHRETQRHADAMRRSRDALAAEVHKLEVAQDDLLDRLVAAGS